MGKRRVILKVSGESFVSDDGKEHLDPKKAASLAHSLKKLSSDFEIGVVVGGGNITRGRSRSEEVHPSVADEMGMLATLINALFFAEFLGEKGVVFSAIETSYAKKYERKEVLHAMREGKIAVFAGGSGNPHFTTDTALVLRGVDLDADEVWKATLVDGVYDKDPKKYPDAKLFKTLSFDEALARDLKIMDQTAFALAKSHSMKIRVFPFSKLEHVKQEDLGTIVYGS